MQALGCDKEKPRDEQGTLALTPRGYDLSICRDHRGKKSTEWLEGLRGKIAIQRANLLRLGHERLESRLCEFGLNFNRLVARLHA